MIFDTAEYNMIGRNWNALTLHQHEPFWMRPNLGMVHTGAIHANIF